MVVRGAAITVGDTPSGNGSWYMIVSVHGRPAKQAQLFIVAKPDMEFDRILPNLYIGYCPKTVEEIERLRQRGVTAVLNLQSDQDFAMHALDWPALHARYLALGVEVRRVPIRDYDHHNLGGNLAKAATALGELLDGGHTVFIHCNAGVNRSPSVVIAYLHWVQGWDLEEAARHVQNLHCCAPVMDAIRRATNDRMRES